MSAGDEFARIVRSHQLYQSMVRLLRRGPDTMDKTREFRRDVLNAIAADEFERTELANCPKFRDRGQLLEHCLRSVPKDWSDFVELGVGSGVSTRLIMATARKIGLDPVLHGFDSFQGLPEAWAEIAQAGTYAYPKPHLDDPKITFHTGWFADTLPGFVACRTKPIGFVHVDCDIYSSTITALTELTPLLASGTVLLFDEYWNYLEASDHEQKALREFCLASGLGFRYLGYNADYMQAAVVLTAANSVSSQEVAS